MNVGLYLDMRNPSRWRSPWPEVYAAALELCQGADALGAHSIWLSEHHSFDDGYLPQPLTLAAAIAARTQRIRLGTAVMLAPLRPAAQIAEEAAIVDLVSGGRLDLGLGAGYRAPEFELYGADPSRPLGTLFQRVREVRELVASSGITPCPAQSPFPLWVGCNGPKGAREVGRLGESLLSVQLPVAGEYLAGLEEGGHDSASARMSGPVGLFLSDDPERDWPVVGRYFAYQWDTYARAGVEGMGRLPPPPADPEQARERGLGGGLRGCLVTTLDDAAGRLRDHFAGYPIETIFSWAWLPGVPEATVQRHVELMCELGSRLAGA